MLLTGTIVKYCAAKPSKLVTFIAMLQSFKRKYIKVFIKNDLNNELNYALVMGLL